MLTSLTLLSLLAAPAADSLVIRYVGNAGVTLSDGKTTLAMDLPYEPGAFGYMTYDPTTIEAAGRTVAVITHGHADHFHPGLWRASGWDIVGPEEVTRSLPAGRVVTGWPVEAGDFRIERISTGHAGTEHYSYLVTWRGRRLYFPGDTEDPAHLLTMRGLDLLFVTPWLSCAVAQVGARFPASDIVLYHQSLDIPVATCGGPRTVAQGARWTLAPRP